MKARKDPRVLFMFSGQGSHYYQMGKEFMQEAVFAEWMQRGDAILEDLGRPAFLKEYYNNPQSTEWSDLLLTHPGLVIIQYATFQLLKSLGIQADAVLGSSVGEFVSAAVAKVWSFEKAVQAAYHQAERITQNCPIGGMVAVLGSSELYWNSDSLNKTVHLAGINFTQHFIISGLFEPLKEAQKTLQSLNVNCQKLPVDYAFHSPEIEAAKLPFETYCKTQHRILKSPEIPLISGIEGRTLEELPTSYFWDAIYEPTDFQKTIRALETQGETLYVDLGPSGTMATFVKYNLTPTSPSVAFPLLTPFHTGQKQLKVLQEKMCLGEFSRKIR